MHDKWVSESRMYRSRIILHIVNEIIHSAIYAVTINGERNVEFSYDDPNMQIFAEDDPRWSNYPSVY
jgi:hypothetical protein